MAQVASTNGIVPRMWVRLFMPSSDSTGRRRLQSIHSGAAPRAGRKLRQALPVPQGKVSVLGGAEAPTQPVPNGKVTVLNTQPQQQPQQQQEGPVVPLVFEDPSLQAALEAAMKAQWEIAAAVDADPNKVCSCHLLAPAGQHRLWTWLLHTPSNASWHML